ncbi:MAG: Gfo/Idh/MocA family oxidoreductase [Chloroflexota bacterium]|nr:Gfo/Idh/MocA family oxidoreductase [Chloroflexota bacterium]
MSVKLGVLGAGIIARSFMEAAPDVPGLEVAVICDVVEASARALATPYGIAWQRDYRAVLADEAIDAVYIALPHHLHEEAAVASARAGKHILLEKPMANSLEEADRILEAQKQSGVKLMLGFTHRFHAELETAKRLIDAGELGQVTLALDIMTTGGQIPGWFWQKEQAGGGVLHVNGAHSFDRLRWLVGSEVVEVFAYAETYDARKTVEDSTVVAIRFENGAMGSTIHNWVVDFALPFKCDLDLYGSAGAIRIDTWNALEFSNARHTWTQRRERDDMFQKEISEFVGAILEDRDPCVTGEDGRRSLACVAAAYESARTGKPVRINH